MVAARAPDLWAITSFFNPMRYRLRRENYDRFRAALDMPLATVELGFGGDWELGQGDADLYLRVGDGDILWQKERLLNLLIARLPASCTHVAWLDCDLLPDGSWSQPLLSALAHAPLVQAYRCVHYLSADGRVEKSVDGIAASIAAGNAAATVLAAVTDRTRSAPTPGMGWAASRALLGRHGLYDNCIIGGGDTALACAAYGTFDTVADLHCMNPAQWACYRRWADPFHADIAGMVGFAALGVRHLWHGDLANRQAGRRHRGLIAHRFDPDADLVPGRDGAWRWASDKPALHQYLLSYFRARAEDGAVVNAANRPTAPSGLHGRAGQALPVRGKGDE